MLFFNSRVPDTAQREAERSDAPLIRDPKVRETKLGPGSAAHRFALRCARDTEQFR